MGNEPKEIPEMKLFWSDEMKLTQFAYRGGSRGFDGVTDESRKTDERYLNCLVACQ